jgi:carboxypeptidase PM20D1
LIFTAVLLFNTIRFESSQLICVRIEKSKVPDGSVERFLNAISIPTISFENESDFDSIPFKKFNDFLINNYPLIHTKCEHRIFNEFSHLFKWEGKDPTLNPIILMAHIDVVPIASLPLWTAHPFKEGIRNDTIFGRGTMDDKTSLIGILESVEQLISEEFKPQRTIYISLGHDEEILGKRGAVAIAQHLESENIKAHFILDEGMAKLKNLIPNLNKDIALIGVAEKGFLSLELTIALAGGHSSTPAKETAIDVLSSAISKIKKTPLKAKISPILNDFFDKLGPEMDFKTKLAFANRGIFKSMILGIYEKTDAGNALIRTTTSPTIFEAGIKENVIPTSARAVINFRIIPGETKEDIINHVKSVVGDDRVKINILNKGSAPSPISPSDNKAYTVIEKSIKEIFPEVLTAPSLVVGATDSRYFKNISNNIYRFVPYQIDPENINCFHGIDERILASEFDDAIRFYRRVILNGMH